MTGTYAIVLNWNGREHTLACVRSLLRSRPRPPEIVVVDNGSTDGSVAALQDAFPDVRVLLAGRNLGYAGGNNLGVRVALDEGAERIVLVNNDVEVDAGMLHELERALDEDERVGVAGPLILLPGRERIWAAGGELSHRENVTRLRGNGQRNNGRFHEDEDVDYIPGCVLMVRREVFERLGLLDETFFCYMEDVEFGHRVRDAGLRNRFVASSRAVHDASASTGGGYTAARKYMNAVNSVRYLRRHPSARGWIGFLVFDLLGLPAAFVVAAARGRGGAAIAKGRGIVDGLLGREVDPERVARYLAAERDA